MSNELTPEDLGLVHPTNDDGIALDHMAHMDDTFVDEAWQPAGVLENPDPRVGFVQRWIRIGYGDEAISNIRKRLNEGWKPRKLDTLPVRETVPLIQEGRFPESIIVQDMCLMEMPEKRNSARTAHYEEQTRAITRAIDSDLQAASSIGGTQIDKESHTQVSTATGRAPLVGND